MTTYTAFTWDLLFTWNDLDPVKALTQDCSGTDLEWIQNWICEKAGPVNRMRLAPF